MRFYFFSICGDHGGVGLTIKNNLQRNSLKPAPFHHRDESLFNLLPS